MNDNYSTSRAWFDLQREEERWRYATGAPGGGGSPTFDSMGRRGSAALGSAWRSFEETLSRVDRVRRALDRSRDVSRSLIAERLAGIDLSSVWHVLVEVCQDIALIYGGSVVLGASVGGVGGFFAGGVGAVPGAALGATLGAQLATGVLAFLGLKDFVVGLVETIPDAMRCYERGFRQAWGPAPMRSLGQPGDLDSSGNVFFAAADFGEGHVLLVIAILSCFVAYITRGRGDKGLFLAQVRNSSRLGPRVARWIEENEERLLRHPVLQSRAHRGGAGAEQSVPSTPPSRSGAPVRQEAREAAERMAEKHVPCFEPNDLPKAKWPELERQLKGQQAGLNEMTVEEYLEGRRAFKAEEVTRNATVGRKARADYERMLINDMTRDLREQGIPLKEAKAQAAQQAAQKMATLAALHNPDMIAAGRDVISDFGDRNVNSRIGSQWRSRVGELDEAAELVPKSARAKLKMNAKLFRCG